MAYIISHPTDFWSYLLPETPLGDYIALGKPGTPHYQLTGDEYRDLVPRPLFHLGPYLVPLRTCRTCGGDRFRRHCGGCNKHGGVSKKLRTGGGRLRKNKRRKAAAAKRRPGGHYIRAGDGVLVARTIVMTWEGAKCGFGRPFQLSAAGADLLGCDRIQKEKLAPGTCLLRSDRIKQLAMDSTTGRWERRPAPLRANGAGWGGLSPNRRRHPQGCKDGIL